MAAAADVPMLGAIPTGIPKLLIPTFPPHLLAGMFGSAAILAMLGAIDSLLTSLVADQITGTYHNSDRELIGQVGVLCQVLSVWLGRMRRIFPKHNNSIWSNNGVSAIEASAYHPHCMQ